MRVPLQQQATDDVGNNEAWNQQQKRQREKKTVQQTIYQTNEKVKEVQNANMHIYVWCISMV